MLVGIPVEKRPQRASLMCLAAQAALCQLSGPAAAAAAEIQSEAHEWSIDSQQEWQQQREGLAGFAAAAGENSKEQGTYIWLSQVAGPWPYPAAGLPPACWGQGQGGAGMAPEAGLAFLARGGEDCSSASALRPLLPSALFSVSAGVSQGGLNLQHGSVLYTIHGTHLSCMRAAAAAHLGMGVRLGILGCKAEQEPVQDTAVVEKTLLGQRAGPHLRQPLLQ
ncbi:MAG: hypothetical protein FRX49_11844 [Trebouxia sp. A1-2]|nr:MAG: hypothetical protein FRX49_11844 [Trebouxia sp. A1-2]